MLKKAFFVSCLAAAIEGLSLRQDADTTPSAYTDLLAQLFDNVDYDACMVVSDRAKESEENYKRMKKTKGKFEDPAFPRDATALIWPGEVLDTDGMPKQAKLDTVTWERLSEKYPDSTLFGQANIRPQDIQQGSVGNCWFLSASACVAIHAGRMETVFNNDLTLANKTGYAVNMFTLGVPSTIVVDDFMPFIDGKPMSAKVVDDGSLWPLVLEKALAKMRGNYQHISGGQASRGIRYLRGGPYEKHETKYMTGDEIYALVDKETKAGNLMTAGSNTAGKDSTTDKWGIVQSHAYSIIGAITLSNKEKLIKLRNPHARDSYRGSYGAESSNWTAKLIKEIPDAQNVDDGFIYVPADQVKVSFRKIEVNFNIDNYSMDYYLKLGDTKAAGPGDDRHHKAMVKNCGASCTHHTMKIASSVKQKVYISLNLWHEDTMMKSCSAPGKGKNHYYFPAPENAFQPISATTGGDHIAGPYNFGAGEALDFKIAMNFDSNRPHDWAVTAWGNKGAVFVYNSDGSASQQFYRSTEMQKHEVKSRPAVSTFTKAVNMGAQPTPPTLTEVANPQTWVPPPYDPMPEFQTIIAALEVKPNSYSARTNTIHKEHFCFIAKNTYTVNKNRKVIGHYTISLRETKKIEDKWIHATNGFDRKTQVTGPYTVEGNSEIGSYRFELMPGQEFGFIMNKNAEVFPGLGDFSATVADEALETKIKAEKEAAKMASTIAKIEDDWKAVTLNSSGARGDLQFLYNINTRTDSTLALDWTISKAEWDKRIKTGGTASVESMVTQHATDSSKMHLNGTLQPNESFGIILPRDSAGFEAAAKPLLRSRL